jgi:hypothetical protein
MLDPARVLHATGAPDLPRAGGLPLIADQRNDENLILSQLHLALMLFHNKVVDGAGAGVPRPRAVLCRRRGRWSRGSITG